MEGGDKTRKTQKEGERKEEPDKSWETDKLTRDTTDLTDRQITNTENQTLEDDDHSLNHVKRKS